MVTHKDKIKDTPTNFEQFWIEVVETHLHLKKMISFLYRRLQKDSTDSKWELEANTIIEDEEWEESWMPWHKCLSSQTWKEFIWKLRMRFFLKTPLVISNYDIKSNPLCWRRCSRDFFSLFFGGLALNYKSIGRK